MVEAVEGKRGKERSSSSWKEEEGRLTSTAFRRRMPWACQAGGLGGSLGFRRRKARGVFGVCEVPFGFFFGCERERVWGLRIGGSGKHCKVR